ncbi:hypothetical protein EVB27_043 [Rhizobium phage RHph_TM16]|nr:hypothetical protein EVB27_043 [Rhizobium phage RHph_TM16]
MADPNIIEVLVDAQPAVIEVITGPALSIIEVVVPGLQGPAPNLGTAAYLNIHVGPTPPDNPEVNQIWIDTHD